MNFQNIKFSIQGKLFNELAAKKVGFLMARRDRVVEQIEVIQRSILSLERKEELVTSLDREIVKIKKAISFCQTLTQFIMNSDSYDLTPLELDFLTNDEKIDYE